MNGQINSIKDIINLPINETVSARDVSKISGINQVKGIHALTQQSPISAVILCTLHGEAYKNEWIEEPNLLKYYLEARTKDGIKTYNPNIKSNNSIITSTYQKPLIVLVRKNKQEKFANFGKFIFKELVTEADQGMYFVLQKIDSSVKYSEILTSEDDEEFPEGRNLERLHKSKERNKRLIIQAKKDFIQKNNGLFCEVCGFDFEEIYGNLGENYIEAHHMKPLSEFDNEVNTKISDLLMVCANCHRMLHRKRPWLQKEQLKSILKR